jgi:hypothetical protein
MYAGAATLARDGSDSAAREVNTALMNCLSSLDELLLVAPEDVGHRAQKLSDKLNDYKGNDASEASAISSELGDLTERMRVDLGESAIKFKVKILWAPDEETAESPTNNTHSGQIDQNGSAEAK